MLLIKKSLRFLVLKRKKMASRQGIRNTIFSNSSLSMSSLSMYLRFHNRQHIDSHHASSLGSERRNSSVKDIIIIIINSYEHTSETQRQIGLRHPYGEKIRLRSASRFRSLYRERLGGRVSDSEENTTFLCAT